MSPRLAQAVAVAAAGFALFSPTAHASTWSAPATVAPGAALNAASPVVASDAAGNLTAAWTGATTGLGVYTATRAAGAAAWSTPVRLAPVAYRPRDVRLAVSPAGHAVVAWTDLFDGEFVEAPDQRIKTATRSASGAWSSVVALENPVDPNVDQAVTVEPGGRLVGLWARGYEGTLGGIERAQGSAPVNVNPPAAAAATNNGPAFDIAIDAAGTATALFTSADGQAILTSTHPAGGAWKPGVELERFASDEADQTVALPSLAVTADGRAVAAWSRMDPLTFEGAVRVARRNAAGSWAAASTVQPIRAFETSVSIDAGIDSTGRSTVLYDFRHYDGIDSGTTPSVWQEVRSSTVAGGTNDWSAPELRSSRQSSADPLLPYFSDLGLDVTSEGQTLARWVDGGNLFATARPAAGVWEPAASIATGVEFDGDAPTPVVASVITPAAQATVLYVGGTALFSRTAALAPQGGSTPDPVVKDPDPVVKDPDPVVKDPGPVVKDPAPSNPTPSTTAPPAAQTPTKAVAPAKIVVSLYVLPSGKKCPAVAAATVDGVRTNLKVAKTKLRKKLACKVTGTVVLKPTVKAGTKVPVLITAKGIKRKSVQLPATV